MLQTTTNARPSARIPELGPFHRRSTATQERKLRSHAVVPGGAHTYAKGDDQYPVDAPAFLERGSGCRVWDSDGNQFIEYGMGLRSVVLGHGFPRVVDAVARQLAYGANFNRPSSLELEAAERLQGLVQRDHMVKFAKNGSDVTTAAVRLARAYTGRELVGVCGDQPFFSVDDWFVATTPMSAGIPDSVGRATVRFPYGDLAGVAEVFDRHPGQLACLVLEAAKESEPPPGYLLGLQELCRANGTLLVLDEMITGFRYPTGTAQRHYGLEPDLSTFGKGLGNGFSVAALVGRPEVMELGGWHHDRQRVFLLSTTHGAETHALAAAIATIDTFAEEPVVEVLHDRGRRLAEGCNDVAASLGISGSFDVVGRASNLVFRTRDADGRPSQVFRTLFMQQLIRGGVVAPSFVVSYSHTVADIDHTIEVVGDALALYRRALEDGPGLYLDGRPVQPAFRRYR